MGRRNNLTDFDHSWIAMAWTLGQSVSKTADLWGVPGMQWLVTGKSCLRKETVNPRPQPQLTDARGERRRDRLLLYKLLKKKEG